MFLPKLHKWPYHVMDKTDLHCSSKNLNQPERKAFLWRQKWDATPYPYLSSLLMHVPVPSRKVEGSVLTWDRELAKMSLEWVSENGVWQLRSEGSLRTMEGVTCFRRSKASRSMGMNIAREETWLPSWLCCVTFSLFLLLSELYSSSPAPRRVRKISVWGSGLHSMYLLVQGTRAIPERYLHGLTKRPTSYHQVQGGCLPPPDPPQPPSLCTPQPPEWALHKYLVNQWVSPESMWKQQEINTKLQTA